MNVTIKTLLDKNKASFLNQPFKEMVLHNHEIFEKEFDNCEFSNCDFHESIFQKCKFYECKFIRCNLSVIKVKNCSFFDTLFEDCKTIGIDWTLAAWPRIKLSSPIKFDKCILNDSSFMGLSLREIIMTDCKAHEVDFRDADCTQGDFTATDFHNSLFNHTNLTNANFAEAVNYNIHVLFNEIKQAKFTLPEAANLLRSLDIELLD